MQVHKAYLFAAYDGCCEEQNSFFGIWRPAQLRNGPDRLSPYTQPRNLPQPMPLPAAAAFAVASALADVPSGRAPGVFVVDNTETRQDGALPPSCIAFEGLQKGTAPLAVLFNIGHALNSLTNATIALPAALAASAKLLNGYGTPLPLLLSPGPSDTLLIALSITPLPQYLLLPTESGSTTAAAACSSLLWGSTF
jgi:hypothetical protein